MFRQQLDIGEQLWSGAIGHHTTVAHRAQSISKCLLSVSVPLSPPSATCPLHAPPRRPFHTAARIAVQACPAASWPQLMEQA